jgi:NAD(P)H-hydrate epimerase
MTQPQKVLASNEMHEIDRRTIESGIPGIILMENAAERVVELLVEKFSPLKDRRIVVVCGRGNNGGDGLAIARQLHTRFAPKSLDVILTAPADDLSRDAAANLQMLNACGFAGLQNGLPVEVALHLRFADIVIDAVLGTGITGEARGVPLEAIRLINRLAPNAKVVSVDLPSGMSSDSGAIPGEFVRADYVVTFTAPKPCHVLAPACDQMGEWRLARIGTPPSMFQNDPAIDLSLITPEFIAPLFSPRPKESNKGLYGHVLVIAGSRSKPGAAAMTGLAALRAGAGLVTVAAPSSAVTAIASHSAELMTVPLPETAGGELAEHSAEILLHLPGRMNVVAVGPGLGNDPETVSAVRRLYREMPKAMVVDADGLNALAGSDWVGSGQPRVLTPHPGEMSRLSGKETTEVQADRTGVAREFSMRLMVDIVLKGNRTLIAMPDGQVWVNPTGSPAMATGGTGDILTGMIAGLMAQFDESAASMRNAAAAAVYLHGLAGEIGAKALGEKSLLAGDLLRYLPEAIRALGA